MYSKLKKNKFGKFSKGMIASLNTLIAFAAGAFVGDAIIHIIPHAFTEVAELKEMEESGEDSHAGHGHRFL